MTADFTRVERAPEEFTSIRKALIAAAFMPGGRDVGVALLLFLLAPSYAWFLAVKWKRFVVAASAVFAATAGAFQGHYIGLLSPTPMKFNEMTMIVIMVIVGGLRTFPGPILGAVFTELLFEWLRARASRRWGIWTGKVLVDAMNPLKVLTCRATVVYPKGRDS